MRVLLEFHVYRYIHPIVHQPKHTILIVSSLSNSGSFSLIKDILSVGAHLSLSGKCHHVAGFPPV